MERWTSHFMELMGETKTRTILEEKEGREEEEEESEGNAEGGEKGKDNFLKEDLLSFNLDIYYKAFLNNLQKILAVGRCSLKNY